MARTLMRLIYTSRPQAELNAEALRAIVARSAVSNQRANITGVLIFDGGIVAQILEGAADDLERTYKKISCDRRHSQLQLLEFTAVSARAFPTWHMSFIEKDQLPRDISLANARDARHLILETARALV